MKYFAPELLARCRSLDDDVAEAAAAEWEQAINAYNRRLEEIRRHLPLGARQVLKHIALHDAQLLTINRAGRELFLTFRLSGSAGKPAGGVELHYSLVRPAELIHHEPPAQTNGPFTRWVLYDEWAMSETQPEAFSHRLLLTGGLELRIACFDVRLRRYTQVLLADSRTSDIERELAEVQPATP
jgi:hypothetical protein